MRRIPPTMFQNPTDKIRDKLVAQYGESLPFEELLAHAERQLKAENIFRMREMVVNIGEDCYHQGRFLGQRIIEGGFVLADDVLRRYGGGTDPNLRREVFLSLFIVQGLKLVRLKVFSSGNVMRDTYVYFKDIVHVSVRRRQVVAVEFRGSERVFDIVFPTYDDALQFQDKLDESRTYPPERKRA
jgi:hypothetical protein